MPVLVVKPRHRPRDLPDLTIRLREAGTHLRAQSRPAAALVDHREQSGDGT
jgi:hypothetical protein